MSTSEEMTCQEITEVVTDYLEGALSQADRRRFEAHLEACPYCVEYVAQVRATIDTLGKVSADSIRPESRDRLLAAFRGWRQGGPR